MPLIVVLDDVRSLYNVGSVFRSCDAFRVEAIYLCGITACPPNPEIHKTALGGEDSVDWKYFKTAAEAVESLHADGFTVYSIEQVEGSTKLQDFEPADGKKYETNHYNLDAILAVVLGGTLMTGGRFSLLASALGALVIWAFTISVSTFGVPAAALLAAKAVLVLVVILLYSDYTRRFMNRLFARKGPQDGAAV